MLYTCEICIYRETRGRIASSFRRWSEYEEHMRLIHQLLVTKDGMHALPANPAPTSTEEL